MTGDPNTEVKPVDIGKAGSNLGAADINYRRGGAGSIYYMTTNVKLVLWYDSVTGERTKLPGYMLDLKDNVFACRLQFRF